MREWGTEAGFRFACKYPLGEMTVVFKTGLQGRRMNAGKIQGLLFTWRALSGTRGGNGHLMSPVSFFNEHGLFQDPLTMSPNSK